MTAAEWQAGDHPEEMLAQLGKGADGRKLRLFLVACARRVLPADPDGDLLNVLDVAERFADGLASKAMLADASAALKASHPSRASRWSGLYNSQIRSVPAWHATRVAIFKGAREGVGTAAWASTRRPDGSGTVPMKEWRAQSDLLREIFGNPFAKVVAPSRLSPSVRALARETLQARSGPHFALDVARLSVIADAFEDAGADELLTAHLRSAGPHVRGCFALDLILQGP